MLQRKLFIITNASLLLLINASNVWAQWGNLGGAMGGGNVQDVNEATNQFSGKILSILTGPLVKVVAGVVLFVGVAGLLRGKHQVAVSCGIAFVLLLCLPIILGYFGGTH